MADKTSIANPTQARLQIVSTLRDLPTANTGNVNSAIDALNNLSTNGLLTQVIQQVSLALSDVPASIVSSALERLQHLPTNAPLSQYLDAAT